MALGGFQRKLKIEAGTVRDHRPVNSSEATGPEWAEVAIPADLPLNLHAMISLGVLSWNGVKLTWPADVSGKHAVRVERTQRRTSLDRAADMETRRAVLVGMGKSAAAARAIRARDRLLAEAGEEDS